MDLPSGAKGCQPTGPRSVPGAKDNAVAGDASAKAAARELCQLPHSVLRGRGASAQVQQKGAPR